MGTPDAFVQAFQRYWAAPKLEMLDGILHSDVVLIQPLSRPARGLAHAKRQFARIFALMPDLHAEVDGWSAAGDVVFIEFRLIGTLGGRRLEWPAIDRFHLPGPLAMERISYFDSLPILGALLTRPSCWPRAIRSGIWRSMLGG
jgi:hypothetical protein